MSDADLRLERLERLTRLRDSGALSAEEFAVEKRRVLMGEAPSPAPARKVTVAPVQPVPEAYDDEPEDQSAHRRRFPFVKVIAGVAVASAVAAAAFINTTPSDVPGRSAPKVATPRRPVVPASVTPPPAAVAGVDLSPALRFRDAGQCAFASATDKLFDTLLPSDDDGDPVPSPKRTTIAGLDLPVASSTDAADDVVPGGRMLKASVRFPEGTRWNALKMSRIVREHGDFPDTDDTDTRMLTFLNPAEDVQAALKLVGASVPISPKARAIDNSGGSCGGTMQVLPVSGGAALVCHWSC